MRRIALLAVLATCFAALVFIGCSKRPEAADERERDHDGDAARGHSRLTPLAGGGPAGDRVLASADFLPTRPAEATPEEKYDAALLDALNLAVDGKLADALASLEAARAVQDTDQIRQQIERMRDRIARKAAADRTVQDIQTVLQDGRPEDASQLATAGLQQYGGGDAAVPLTAVKQQADALAAAQVDDAAGQRTRFRLEGEAALRDSNLRAAAVAFEQALQSGDAPDVRRQLDDIRAALARYDDNRRRAAELRRDPINLEDAIAALQEAARAWDTLEVRQDIDDYTLALQKRRERLSVADFEVLGDVGIAYAGRTVAEELLPAFKPRFNLAEREQIGKIIGELNLAASELGSNDTGRRELGRLARLRYLVVGSVSPLCGITVHARLVDVRSGLVVQTAKVSARTPEELLPRLPQLANMLMMTDEQKMAYEQQLAIQRALPSAFPVNAALPPPPEVLLDGQAAPPPIVAYAPQPPGLALVAVQDFQALSPPAPDWTPPAVAVDIGREDPVRERLFRVAVELGDNLFLRGRFVDAHAQFSLALNLSPRHRDISIRIDRCRPRLPPPPPVVVVVPPPPRVAVMNFVVNADPGLVPVGFSDWAADQMASYFVGPYQVVDRGEVCWYMGRLGITMRDVLTNASARLWLGRALNVRFFVFGIVEQTHSFNVSTHLVDAETGVKQGGGMIHVQDHQELKLRMGELAQQTRSDPAQQARLQREAQDNENQLAEARRLLKAGDAARAIGVSQEALKRQPNNVGIQDLLQQAQQQARLAALEESRRAEEKRRQALAAAAQQRQAELARATEAARLRAVQAAAVRSDADRRALDAQRQKAAQQLRAQGQRALAQGNSKQALQLLQGAVALKPTDAAVQELSQARARAEATERTQAVEQKVQLDAELRRKQQAELAQTRANVEAERRARQAQDEARRKTQDARDLAAQAKLLNNGKQLLAQNKYAAAVAALQSAVQLRKTDEGQRLLQQALAQQAHAAAQPQAPPGRATPDQQRQEEEGKRRQAEADKRSKEEQQKRAAADADARLRQEQARRAADFARFMAQGQTALSAQRYGEAVQGFSEAVQLRPTDPGAARGLRDAQQALDRSRTPPPPPKTAPQPPRPRAAIQPPPPMPAAGRADYARQMQAGATYEKRQKYVEALAAYREALRLLPGDANALAAARKVEFSLHMAEGRKDSTARRYADAAREYEAALKLFPGQPDAASALKRAREGRP